MSERITALDDPARPERRVYRTEGGLYVKVYTITRRKFGRLDIFITASQCDETGKALRDPVNDGEDAMRILTDANANPDRHEVQINGANTNVAAELDAGIEIMIARVVDAEALSRIDPFQSAA